MRFASLLSSLVYASSHCLSSRAASTLSFSRRPTNFLTKYRLITVCSAKMASTKHQVCIIGSGNWGTAIARIVGETVKLYADFDERVNMWVFEEMIDGKKLSEIINTTHENVKYLPGMLMPPNVVAVTDLVESVKNADILIFVVPHQFVRGICTQIVGKLKPGVVGISLIKPRAVFYPYVTDEDEGLAVRDDGGIKLISEVIAEIIKMPVYALMGANLAHEVAGGNFCEATIGAPNLEHGALLKRLFQTDNFRIVVVEDAHTVELCGALKNVVACGAGFTDGLGYGGNTKAAVIRLGLMEMTHFIKYFYPGSNLKTFFESCGIADLITTCYGGRNRKVCEAFVKTGKSIEVLEKELLNGQSLQGPHTANSVFKMLETHKMEDKFPLFASIHRICNGQLKPDQMIDCLRHHPEHMDHPVVIEQHELIP